MNSPVHFAVGAAICRYTPSRPLGFVLALASHFVLDALPHLEEPWLVPWGQPLPPHQWQAWLLRVQFATVLVLVAAALRLWQLGWRSALWYPLAGGLFACLPDVVTAVFYYHNPVGWLNSVSHVPWHALVHPLIAHYPEHARLIGAGLLTVETAVLLTGCWFLFRGNPGADAIAPIVEDGHDDDQAAGG